MPKLSFVVTARNDNHGGDFLRRIQLFIANLFQQARQFGLSMELIIVEWNPVPDAPSLADSIAWPRLADHCQVRLIQVSPQLHAQFAHADKIQLFQMIAKNVGVRRAQGEFVLSTNVDLLFTPQLIQFLAESPLRRDTVYRIDRHDVPAELPFAAPLEAQLRYCAEHILRVHTDKRLTIPNEGMWQQFVRLHPFKRLWWLWRYSNRPQTVTEWGQLAQRGICWLQDRLWQTLPPLHLNASGDFTLLAKSHWCALRGYPELTGHPMHLDSIFCYMAHYSGLREVVLRDPMRIYHLEHGNGSGNGMAQIYKEMYERNIPILTFSEVRLWSLAMKRGQRPLIHNNEQWGLAGQNLPEKRIRYT